MSIECLSSVLGEPSAPWSPSPHSSDCSVRSCWSKLRQPWHQPEATAWQRNQAAATCHRGETFAPNLRTYIPYDRFTFLSFLHISFHQHTHTLSLCIHADQLSTFHLTCPQELTRLSPQAPNASLQDQPSWPRWLLHQAACPCLSQWFAVWSWLPSQTNHTKPILKKAHIPASAEHPGMQLGGGGTSLAGSTHALQAHPPWHVHLCSNHSSACLPSRQAKAVHDRGVGGCISSLMAKCLTKRPPATFWNWWSLQSPTTPRVRTKTCKDLGQISELSVQPRKVL